MTGISELAFAYASHAAAQYTGRVRHGAHHRDFAAERLLNLASWDRGSDRDDQLFIRNGRANLLDNFLYNLRLYANKNDVSAAHCGGVIRAHRHVKFFL